MIETSFIMQMTEIGCTGLFALIYYELRQIRTTYQNGGMNNG